jgi:hypothetical protein
MNRPLSSFRGVCQRLETQFLNGQSREGLVERARSEVGGGKTQKVRMVSPFVFPGACIESLAYTFVNFEIVPVNS